MEKSENKILEKNEELRRINLAFFKARFGEEIQIDPDEDKKYRMEAAANGEPVLYIRGAMNGEDLRINSTYDPSYEAERWAEKQDIQNRRTTIALMGFATGVFLKALMKKLRPDTVFFVIEPIEGLFAYVCAYVDISEFLSLGRIHFAITETQKNHLSDDMIHDVATFRPEAKGIVTPFYTSSEKFEDLCEELQIMMDSTKNYQKDRGRNALRCRMYAWNHMRNAFLIGDLRDRIPKDIPAIIVSAGPSLSKNVDVLQKIKGHAFILCTDRALLALDERGIVPDAVISLDAEKSADYMRLKVAENIPVICSYQLNIDSQKLFYDRRIFYHALAYEYHLIGEKVCAQNGLDQGGNVAGGAFTVCEFLGLKTIILIGQDLAFLNGKHHADGKNDGVPQLDVREIMGIDGNMVQSNDMWIGFRNFFERQIAMHPEMRVIDATEGGALIEGTEIMTLEEVANNICTKEYDLKKIFDDLPFAENEEEYLNTVKVQEEWIKDLEMIARNSEELALLSKQLMRISMYQDITDPKNNKKLNKMDSLRNEIYGTLINTLMEEFWIEDLYSIPDYTFMVRNNEEAIPVFRSAMMFFEHFPKDCMSLKEELQNAIDVGKEDFEREKNNNAGS